MNPEAISRFRSGFRVDSKRTDWSKAGSGNLCNVAKRSSNKGAQTPVLEVMLFLVFEVGLYLHTLLVPSSWPSGDTTWLIGKDGEPTQWQSRDGLLYSQCLAPGAQGTTVARLNLESSPEAEFDPGTYHKRFHCDKNKHKVEGNGTYIVYCCTTASAEAPGTDEDVWNELTQFRLWSKDKKHKDELDWSNDADRACDSDEKQKLIAALRDEESAPDRPVLEAHNPPADPENNSTCNTTVALFIKDPDTRKRQRGP